ncbi:MAG: glycosyltransferase [Candidatus Micrarchaeia archaeon]
MRIAFFTDTYLPTRDGVVSSILNTRGELERRGHDVFVFCPGSLRAKRENRDPHVFYHTAAPFQPYPDYKIALFPFLSERMVRKLGCQLIHSHGMATMGLAALAVSRALSLPLVGSFHTLVPEAAHYISRAGVVKRLTQRIAWNYVRWYYNQCARTIAPSHAITTLLARHGFRNLRTAPNGIDVERFNPRVDGRPVRAKLGLEANPLILHVGRVALEKNLEVLIRSALLIQEEEPDARFVIAGAGPALEYYKRLAEREGVARSFVFTGFVPDDDLPAYYAACDVFAFPSKFETQGLVALEAMACGKPVAGANYLAISELVKDGQNGFLFNPDSPDDCAKAVLQCLRRKRALARNARATAEKYSIQRCTTRLLKIYAEVL